MIEKAEERAIYSTYEPQKTDAAAAAVNWQERLGVPDRYTAALKSAGGHLTVEVDAKVTLPTVELPVARVEPYVFTDEDVLRFVSALLGDDLKCIENGENWQTRAMLEREILRIKNDLDHWDEYGEQVWGQFDTKAELEAYLQEVIAKAARAPEEPKIIPFALNWEYWNVWNASGKQETTDSYATVLVLNDDGTASSLTVDRGTQYVRCGIRYRRDATGDIHFPALGERFPNELSITEEDARRVAEEKLKEMGLNELSCAFAKSVRCYRGDAYVDGAAYEPYWALVFTHAVNGAQVGYTHQTVVEPSEYNMSWAYETCKVLVDEKGVAYLEYESPSALDRVTVDAATLLPFSKIQEIFEKMVLIVNNYADANGFDQSYRITRVRLSLVCLPEQDGDGCLLVPCWDFLGDLADQY